MVTHLSQTQMKAARYEKRERLFIFSLLGATTIAFFSFGLFHLGKFETTDEHLWKYDRIPAYWQALKEQEWEKTYINDKPGITVALVSGAGLLFEPDPEINERRYEGDPIKRGLFNAYAVDQSEKTNFTFRLPVLIFSTLSLLLFFWLTYQAFASLPIALITTILMAGNPILLGMSQIVNPDSFFWIFGGLGAIAYLALLEQKRQIFVLWCGILTGFALLSKYTAFTLFLFYGLALLAFLLFPKKEPGNTLLYVPILRKSLIDLFAIFSLSLLVFAIFLPGVFFHPEYLFKGIGQFFSLKDLPFFIGSLTLLAGLVFIFFRFGLKKTTLEDALAFALSLRRFLLTTVILLFLGLFFLSFVNVWMGQKFIPIDALRDTAYSNEPQAFNFRPIIPKTEFEPIKNTKLYFMNAYPLVFSLTPLLLVLLFFVSLQGLGRKLGNRTRRVLFTVLSFILLYLVSTLFAKVVTNVRYTILLYPLLALLAAIAFSEYGTVSRFGRKRVFIVGAIILFLTSQFIFFWHRPFYFSYTNTFLPKSFTIHDSWGHGSYEAASYLNALPEAKDLVIWSNSDTVCRFFVGKCLRSRKIDLARVTPDYFVVSKRGLLKEGNHFTLINNPTPEKNTSYYLAKLQSKFVWQLEIGGRPDNFIKIISFEK